LTESILHRDDGHFLFQSHRYRIVVGDRSVDQFLLYHFFFTRVFCGDLRVGGEFDGWGVGGISRTSSGSPGEGGVMDLAV